MKSHPQWCDGNADLPDLPLQLAAPARRALAREGITTLASITRFTETELNALHGIGPNALNTIKSALKQKGLTLSPSR
ncbi:MAG: DNA-directed RNA polymerase subunit alpha C-terminal domain-containing protein [Pseudomonadota bacterium]